MANENEQVGEARQEMLPLGLLPAEGFPGAATGRFAFDPLPRESGRAYAAFRIYLELGPQRTLAKAAEQLGQRPGTLEKWSTRFDWQARVKAHAAHMAEVERLAIEALVKERAVAWDKMHETVRREAWREAEETIEMVRKARQDWLEKGKQPGWEGMARMLELAFKLKQLATGMASEVKEVHTNVTGTLEVEWEVALRKAYGQAKPGPNAPAARESAALAAKCPEDNVIDVETAPTAPDKETTGVVAATN